MVESQPSKLLVAGSIPVSRSSNPRASPEQAELSSETQPGDITLILRRWAEGDRAAVGDLAPLVYDHLRRVATSYLARERSDHTLEATSLVNELFVRLMQQSRARLADRGHFYAFAARAMRGILVDYARGRAAGKRGGGGPRVELSPDLAWIDPEGPAMIDLDAALSDFEQLDPAKARVVELRVFLGCTAEEAAEVLGLSKATVDRHYSFAIAWLSERLEASL